MLSAPTDHSKTFTIGLPIKKYLIWAGGTHHYAKEECLYRIAAMPRCCCRFAAFCPPMAGHQQLRLAWTIGVACPLVEYFFSVTSAPFLWTFQVPPPPHRPGELSAELLELERELCVNVLCAGATPAEGIPGRDLSSSFCVERQDSH